MTLSFKYAGYTVDLVKENTVLSGYHELVLEASDAQGNMAVYNLSVTVCSCLNKEKPDCHSRKTRTSEAGAGIILIVILSILLLAGRTQVWNTFVIADENYFFLDCKLKKKKKHR